MTQHSPEARTDPEGPDGSIFLAKQNLNRRYFELMLARGEGGGKSYEDDPEAYTALAEERDRLLGIGPVARTIVL